MVIGLVLDAVEHGYKNIIVQAPTGIGKSDVGMTLAKKYENKTYFLLSMNLGLCTQYKDDFNNLIEVKGRNNFPCLVKPSKSCESAPCVYRKKYKCDKINRCPYERQKKTAQTSKEVLSTPHYMCRVPRESFPQRYISIWDEAHNLETFFMSMAESYITEREYKYLFNERLPQYPNPDYWRETLKKIEIECGKRLARERFISDHDAERLTSITKRVNIGLALLSRDKKRFIISFEKTKRGKLIVKFRPVKVDTIAHKILEDISEVRVFMSATILNINQFMYNLGLNPEETFYINVTKSPFPIGNRLIRYDGVGMLTFKKKIVGIENVCRKLRTMMRQYPDKRGVILPITHEFRKQIYNYLNKDFTSRILTHGTDKDERNTIIDKFLTEQSEPLVLISTYITEGFSFDGKLAEWLAFVKLPFPDLGNPLIEARLFLEQEQYREKVDCEYIEPKEGRLCANYSCQKCKTWYNLQTATKLVQGLGRIVRSPTDMGEMWILDKSFSWYYNRWGFLLPAWFRESIIWK